MDSLLHDRHAPAPASRHTHRLVLHIQPPGTPRFARPPSTVADALSRATGEALILTRACPNLTTIWTSPPPLPTTQRASVSGLPRRTATTMRSSALLISFSKVRR